MNRTNVERRKFSLTELCVTILLILLISALMLPVAGAVRKEGKKASCEENMKQIGRISALYQFDNAGSFPIR